MIQVAAFLSKVEEIAGEDPTYQHGQDGSHGQCDCIGLIIGAIRRAGGQWRGMHGSNYAARQEVVQLLPVAGCSELTVGEAVFKAYEPGQGGYDLPARYEPGGSSYTGDLRDYYHVGIVESVHPLRIRHMTSPRVKMDTALGKWSYHGKLKKISYAADGSGGQSMGTVIIRGGNLDAPIRMRSAPSKAAPVVAEIPQDSQAELIENSGQWSSIRWDGKDGYVMSEFVSIGSSSGEKISVNRAELEKVYDMIGDMLGLRG